MPIEAKDIFEATSRSFRELMSENGLGLYIPPYQRPYGWDKDKVERLIDDTLHGLARLGQSDDSFTFLGTIITIHDTEYSTIHPVVMDQVPAKVLTVIDGQQRICSLILLSVCLHNQIKLRHSKIFTLANRDKEPYEEWLNGQTLEILKNLSATISERQSYGDTPIYPRIIRAFTDQWSKKFNQSIYESPIAYLISTYSAEIDDSSPGKKIIDFRPTSRPGSIEGEADLVKRYSEIRTIINSLARAESNESFEDLPTLKDISQKKDLQKALLNHEFPDYVLNAMQSPPSRDFSELVRLLLLGAYVLNRIALTVVKGKNENYAFTIFESLNTTGEPLTAFETFKPRVVNAEGLAAYQGSASRTHIDGVTDYLSKFAVGTQLQNATRDLLISFALAETGEKLPKRLADQRVYLKDQYERYDQDPAKRLEFVKHLRETSDFIQHVWEPGQTGTPHFHNLPSNATTDTVQLCISFLRKFNHSIVIGPLVRFYSKSLNSPHTLQPETIQDLESAIQAITAFSIFWRASRRTTGNIDQEYRQIMTGIESVHIGPLARTLRKGISGGHEPTIDLTGLKQELVYRLAHAKNVQIADKQQWVATSSLLPTYKINQALTRFLLLSAYHDTVEDREQLGLISAGKEQSSPSLTFGGWRDEIHLSVEHVVPQEQNASWGEYLGDDKEVIHRIGNLVLLPQAANSSASNRTWNEKRVLYAALGARSKGDASRILTEASRKGIKFSESTGSLVELSKYMPHLAALGEKNDEWDKDFIQARSQRLLELIWTRLRPWLGPEDPMPT